MIYCVEALVRPGPGSPERWSTVEATFDWEEAGNVVKAWFAKGYKVRVMVRRHDYESS
jgi:hypothetical protein